MPQLIHLANIFPRTQSSLLLMVKVVLVYKQVNAVTLVWVYFCNWSTSISLLVREFCQTEEPALSLPGA